MELTDCPVPGFFVFRPSHVFKHVLYGFLASSGSSYKASFDKFQCFIATWSRILLWWSSEGNPTEHPLYELCNNSWYTVIFFPCFSLWCVNASVMLETITCTPPKIQMEPQNISFVHIFFLFPGGIFRSTLVFQGCSIVENFRSN